MNRTRTAAAAALTLAFAVPAVGCGEDDSAQFRDDYNRAVQRLTQINNDIGEAAGESSGQSNREIARRFERIADSAEQTRTDLAELAPPEDARDEFDKLLSALETGVEDLRALAEAAIAGRPQAVSKAVEALSESGQEITAAEDALTEAVDG